MNYQRHQVGFCFSEGAEGGAGCQKTWRWQAWLPLIMTLHERLWCAKMDITTAVVSLAGSPACRVRCQHKLHCVLFQGRNRSTSGTRPMPQRHLAAAPVSSGPVWRESQRFCVYHHKKVPNKSFRNWKVLCQRDRQPSPCRIDGSLLISLLIIY